MKKLSLLLLIGWVFTIVGTTLVTREYSQAEKKKPAGTTIELNDPGNGRPYANFLLAVKTRYAQAWTVPEGVTDEAATATAKVLIARNGDVVNSRIVSFSRNSEVDRSVQATLERVKWAAPFPDKTVEDQREVTIRFNVKARRSLG